MPDGSLEHRIKLVARTLQLLCAAQHVVGLLRRLSTLMIITNWL